VILSSVQDLVLVPKYKTQDLNSPFTLDLMPRFKMTGVIGHCRIRHLFPAIAHHFTPNNPPTPTPSLSFLLPYSLLPLLFHKLNRAIKTAIWFAPSFLRLWPQLEAMVSVRPHTWDIRQPNHPSDRLCACNMPRSRTPCRKPTLPKAAARF
jgi:hypothetical protein